MLLETSGRALSCCTLSDLVSGAPASDMRIPPRVETRKAYLLLWDAGGCRELPGAGPWGSSTEHQL